MDISPTAWSHAVRCLEDFFAVHGDSDCEAASRVLRDSLGLDDDRVTWLIERLVGSGWFADVAAQNLVMGALVALLAAGYDRPFGGELDPSVLLGPG